MTEKILIVNGSKIPEMSILPLNVLAELNQYRDLEAVCRDGKKVIGDILSRHYNDRRNQVNTDAIMFELSQNQEVREHYRDGKLVIVDTDLFSDGLNWCFGCHYPQEKSLGMVILSTARMDKTSQVTDWIAHELGHMFKAPSQGRSNTYEQLGLHCSNDLCVMQQKMTVPEALRYSQQRSKADVGLYCEQCQDDLRNFRGVER